MSKFKQVITVLIIATAITLTAGCGKDTTSSSETTNNTSVVQSTNINDNKLSEDVQSFIKGDKIEGSKFFKAGVEIDFQDINYAFTVIDKYANVNAKYYKIQVEDNYFLYRFQLDEDGLIESYIKYTLEA